MKKHTPQEWADWLGMHVVRQPDGTWEAFDRKPELEPAEYVHGDDGYGDRLVFEGGGKRLYLSPHSDSGRYGGFRLYRDALVETDGETDRRHIWSPTVPAREEGEEKEKGVKR